VRWCVWEKSLDFWTRLSIACSASVYEYLGVCIEQIKRAKEGEARPRFAPLDELIEGTRWVGVKQLAGLLHRHRVGTAASTRTPKPARHFDGCTGESSRSCGGLRRPVDGLKPVAGVLSSMVGGEIAVELHSAHLVRF
jgi:hypothetical protein